MNTSTNAGKDQNQKIFITAINRLEGQSKLCSYVTPRHKHKKKRNFISVCKMFDLIEKCTQKTHSLLLKLKIDCKAKVHTQNQRKQIPHKFQALLMLGLKCWVTTSPNLRFLKKCLREAISKLSWRVCFKTNHSSNKKSDFVINCQKYFRMINKLQGKRYPRQDELFNFMTISKQFSIYCSKFKVKDSQIFTEQVQDFSTFCKTK